MKTKRATNYRRGADAERRAKRDLLFPRKTLPALFRADTWHAVVRAAGSKGDWDMLALGRAQVLALSIKRARDLATARRVLNAERARLERIPLPLYARSGVAGLSQPVDRIIEIDFLGSSRMQAGQRALRLAYDTGRKSAMHVLMTPDEFARFGARLEIYERWGLAVTVESGEGRARALGVVASRAARRASTRTGTPRAQVETPAPTDDIARTLALASLATKIRAVEARVERKYYVRVVLRACWTAALAPQDLALGLGTNSLKTIGRLAQCCRALTQEKLLTDHAGTFRVNQDEIQRLAALADLSQRARGK